MTVSICLVLASMTLAEDWPRWRGPRGDGSWRAPRLKAAWPKTLPRKWRTPIGGGYAGISVSDERVYTMDRQVQPRETERVICCQAGTGRILWTHSYPVSYGKLEYGSGPRAAPTVHRGRIYTLGALGDLFCLDARTGHQVFECSLQKRFAGRLPTWGYAASPLIIGRTVIVQPGGLNGRSIVALDARNGRTLWQSLSDKAAYATPLVIDVAGHPQLVVWTPSHVRGLDPATGKPLWAIPYKVTMGVAIASPAISGDLLLVSGYWEGTRAIRLSPDGRTARLAWSENRFLRGFMSQPLLKDGHAYMLDKQYGVSCFELATGKKLWDDKNRTTPRNRNPQVSLVWLEGTDRALALNDQGELVLMELAPSGRRELARTRIVGPTWSHPAFAGTAVYARSDTELVRVELPIAGD